MAQEISTIRPIYAQLGMTGVQWRGMRKFLTALLYLAPSLIFFLTFIFIPLIKTIQLSTFNGSNRASGSFCLVFAVRAAVHPTVLSQQSEPFGLVCNLYRPDHAPICPDPGDPGQFAAKEYGDLPDYLLDHDCGFRGNRLLDVPVSLSPNPGIAQLFS